MTLKEFIFKKATEISEKYNELEHEEKNMTDVKCIQELARNNGKCELINEIIKFMKTNNMWEEK